MTYHLTCQLCEGPGNPFTTQYLVPIQEHVMSAHGYTQADLQKQTKRETEEGYIYTMPDGKDWLTAVRGGTYVGGL